MLTSVVVSIVLGLGLVLSGGSAAQASGFDQEDLARTIFGLATVAIIARSIDRRSVGTAAKAQVLKSPRRDHVRYVARPAPGVRASKGQIRREGVFARMPKAHRGLVAAPLPARCRVTVETDRGNRHAFSHRCLDRYYPFASKLPDACETLVRTPQGFRSVYGSRCLDRDGWRVSSR